MSIIVIAHPDDEIIGCYSKLRYVEGICRCGGTSERKNEYDGMLLSLGLKDIDLTSLTGGEQVFVPSVCDFHPEHKAAFWWAVKRFKLANITEYSVEKNVDWLELIHPDERLKKTQLLNNLYPSQKSLWENNQKYILFEGYRNLLNKTITIKTEFIALHRWKDAFAGVDYLQDFHRHKFYVEVDVPVNTVGRDLEFFTVQGFIKWITAEIFAGKKLEKSCEEMAGDIFSELYKRHDIRVSKVRVFEDNENGGEVSI